MVNRTESKVILANPEDISQILGLLKLRHNEDGIGEFNEPLVRNYVSRGVRGILAVVGVIKGSRNNVEATAGIYMDAPWYSSEPLLEERWLFVHPDHRRSEHAKSLIAFAKMGAVILKQRLVVTAISNPITEPRVKLLERNLPKSGLVFVFDGNIDSAV